MSLKEKLAEKKAALLAIKADEAGDYTPEQAVQAEALASEIAELEEQVAKSEKAAQIMGSIKGELKEEEAPGAKATDGLTIGERFVKSAAYEGFKAAHPTGTDSGTPIRIEAKGIGTLDEIMHGRKATLTTETGQIPTQREPGYRNYLPGDEPLTFLNLVTTGVTDVPFSEYAQIIGETDNAAVVPEGGLKPTSDVTTALKDSKAFTYADGFDITNQTLADDGALAAFMESRIRRHVMGVVERMLLNGTGTTQPMGIMNTSGTLAQAFDTDVITTLARAFAKFENANSDAEPQAIVMNPADVWALRLLKNADDDYRLGDPFRQNATPTPWGVPLVRSRKVAVGTALVGRFDSVHFLQLEALNVLAFNQHKDYAQRNMTYVRAEMRGRQLIYAPREIVVADLTA